MRFATNRRAIAPRSIVAAALLAGVAIAATGQAYDEDSKANASKASASSSCCSGAQDASAVQAPAACPVTSACPPGMCSTSKTTQTAAVTPRKRVRRAKVAVKPAARASAVNQTPGTAGLQAIIDPQTGRIVQATAEQLGELSSASKASKGVSIQSQPRDPEMVELEGGGQMMRLPERLMMNAVARIDAQGKLTYGCRQRSGATAPQPAETGKTPQSTWEVK